VRETFVERSGDLFYRADEHAAHSYEVTFGEPVPKWRPSIFMTRMDSRITLDVVGVRVERLQSISEADARAEGVRSDPYCRQDDDAAGFHRIGRVRDDSFPIARYAVLWESINGAGSWDANPWVWVVDFRGAAAVALKDAA
jgi:hypothetical protein